VENIIPFVIQINGKKRYVFDVNRNISEEQILKIINQNSNISKFLENKEIKKKIFIANKLINIIV
jgi:leucyl-tRNA synthetase